MRIPVGDVAEGTKMPDGFVEAAIRGGGIGEGLGLSPFVYVLGLDHVNVKLGVVRPQLMGAVRTVAPQQADGAGFIARDEVEAHCEVLVELGILTQEDAERMLGVQRFERGLVAVATEFKPHDLLGRFEGALVAGDQRVEFVLGPGFHGVMLRLFLR